jgi:hypothetical protein
MTTQLLHTLADSILHLPHAKQYTSIYLHCYPVAYVSARLRNAKDAEAGYSSRYYSRGRRLVNDVIASATHSRPSIENHSQQHLKVRRMLVFRPGLKRQIIRRC